MITEKEELTIRYSVSLKGLHSVLPFFRDFFPFRPDLRHFLPSGKLETAAVSRPNERRDSKGRRIFRPLADKKARSRFFPYRRISKSIVSRKSFRKNRIYNCAYFFKCSELFSDPDGLQIIFFRLLQCGNIPSAIYFFNLPFFSQTIANRQSFPFPEFLSFKINFQSFYPIRKIPLAVKKRILTK